VGLGIDLAGAGSVTNAASAAIIGVYGVFISNGAGTVVNFGSTAATAARHRFLGGQTGAAACREPLTSSKDQIEMMTRMKRTLSQALNTPRNGGKSKEPWQSRAGIRNVAFKQQLQ
jgi:hypothetical protein